MTKSCRAVLWVALVCLVPFMLQFENSFAEKQKKMTPEELVAKHLESLGSPEARAAVKSRTAFGLGYVQRPVGTVPQVLPEPGEQTDPTNFLLASAERNLGMVFKFYDEDYPGEHFAWDGKDATIKLLKQNNRSTLGNYMNTYTGLLREGLLGGTLSTAWPLLDVQQGKFKLKYKKEEIDGIPFHQLTYAPRSNRYLVNIVVHLFFNFDTYHHVMTEYQVMGTTAHPTLVVLERFGNFKEVDGLMLPHRYSIDYSPWRETRVLRWGAEIKQVSHNTPIEPAMFHVQ